MSSAPARIPPIVGRAVRGIVWTALFAVLAAGAAGLVAEANHAPGSPARADLTAEGDAALNARLDQATARLQTISNDVDRLADDAKTALEQLASTDPSTLESSLQDGGAVATTIDTETHAALDALAGLPGDEPDAALRYSNDTLVRRAAILAALDAAAGLDAQWTQVTAKATEVAQLMSRIAEHDGIVLDAAAQGRNRHYADAAKTLDQAILAVANVKEQRDKLIPDPSPTVLDQWIERNRDYDLALQALYLALVRSGGTVTVTVQAAHRAEREAFDRLPPDRRTIIVIVAEVARGGLTQAVLAIEDARGRIDDALSESGNPPGPSGTPNESGAPPGPTAPEETFSPGTSGVPLP